MQRTRDGYWGWCWVGMNSIENVGFGYFYQDPATGPNIRVVAENVWGLPDAALTAMVVANNYTGQRIIRLGGAGFESFGSADNPASSLEHTRMFFEMGYDQPGGGMRVLFLPRESYGPMGLPDEPDWVQIYNSASGQPGNSARNMPVPAPMNAPQIQPVQSANQGAQGPMLLITLLVAGGLLVMGGAVAFLMLLL